MFSINVGALRPASDDARHARLAAANDLVQRTLAQHGLLPARNEGHGAPSRPVLPTMEALLAGLALPQGSKPTPTAPLPSGAEFRESRFSCNSGSRACRIYVPSTASDGVAGIVVMLHGCTQTAEDFAIGTGMNLLAEKHGLVVIYPQQSRGDNAQSCWNWFSRGDQRRDRGEPAILAGMTREVMAEFDVPRERTFVAGLSAGAAMAVILGETYPDVFAAIGAHSGLPFGAARDVLSAFAAMAGNLGDAASPGRDRKDVRSIVIHGSADAVVHPSNGDRIVRDVLDGIAGQSIETEEQVTASGRKATRRIASRPDGSVRVEHWVIEGLGHAWSGGNAGGSHTDPNGPDASAEMVRFFFETAGEEV